VLVEGSNGSNTVADGVCEEKIVIFGDISLVQCIFAFLLFWQGDEDCEDAMHVGRLVVRC
jgi:hypothetical protein